MWARKSLYRPRSPDLEPVLVPPLSSTIMKRSRLRMLPAAIGALVLFFGPLSNAQDDVTVPKSRLEELERKEK